MESRVLKDRGLAPPRACAAEWDACVTLESAGSSVPNATPPLGDGFIPALDEIVLAEKWYH